MRVYQTIRRLPYLVNTLQKYDGKNDKMIRDVFTKPFEVGIVEIHQCIYIDISKPHLRRLFKDTIGRYSYIFWYTLV